MQMAVVASRGRRGGNVLPFPRVPSLAGVRVPALLPSGKALLLGFALLAGGALAYFGARETSIFAVRSIQISGAPPRVAVHVRQALRPIEGKSLLVLDASSIGRRLESLPDVASVSYDRDFPHTLRLLITPAHSIAMIRRGPAAWIASSDGRIVRQAGVFTAPNLPRIWVPRVTDVEVGTTLDDADVARAIRTLAAARHSGFAAKISAVRSNDHELTFVLANAPELRLGDTSALRQKLAVARRVLPLVTDSAYVDVSVPQRPVAGGKSQL
jgi:cell division protein FtsQ